MDIRRVYSKLAICLALALALTACEREPGKWTDAEISLLASEAHFIVAGVPIQLPLVATTGEVGGPYLRLRREKVRQETAESLRALLERASNTATAPTFDTLQVTLRAYGWDDSEPSFRRICPQLNREWSRSLCDNPWSPVLQVYPHPDNIWFYLADDRKLGKFGSLLGVGGHSLEDTLRNAGLGRQQTVVACEQAKPNENAACTAATVIKGHLIAVWSTWAPPPEPMSQRTEREGQAIAALVENALGTTENFPLLLSKACKLRSPQASLPPHGDPCADRY